MRSWPTSASSSASTAPDRFSAARRAALALAGGLLLFAGHPPLGQGWLGLVAVAPLLALARDVARAPRPLRAAAAWGFVAGLALFLPLLVWVARFGFVAWALLAVVEAAFVAAFVAGVAAWEPRRWRPLVAIVLWVGLEALRTRWPLGGFPWGVLGYTQHDGGVLLPLARAIGVLGVSAAAVAFAAAAEELLWRVRTRRQRRALALPTLALGAILVAPVLFGGAPPTPTGETVDIAAVQGNDLQLAPVQSRNSERRVEAVAERMLAATRPLASDPPAVTVWPENALDNDPRADENIAAVVEEALDLLDGRPLLAGAMLDGPREHTFYNAFIRFAADAAIVEAYIKRKLVPFGEYVPARWLLGDLPPLRQVPSDGLPGTGTAVFHIGTARIGPVTCYESVYPELVLSQVRDGANVLVVSTNNASFGRSAASRQHLAFSQLRAVESGRWVLHAGISGISAIVDPAGGVHEQTELFEQTIVRGQLPLITAITPATRLGEWFAYTMMALAALAVSWMTWCRVHARRARDE